MFFIMETTYGYNSISDGYVHVFYLVSLIKTLLSIKFTYILFVHTTTYNNNDNDNDNDNYNTVVMTARCALKL